MLEKSIQEKAYLCSDRHEARTDIDVNAVKWNLNSRILNKR